MTKAMPRSAPAAPDAPDAAAADGEAAKPDQPAVSVSAQALVFKQSQALLGNLLGAISVQDRNATAPS